jgi:hypothetical protein
LRRAEARIPAGDPAREPLEVTLLGIYYTSASAHSEAKAAIIDRQKPDSSARGALPAATLVTLAMDEVMNAGSATAAGDLAERALEAGLPVNPHHAWAGLAMVALAVADRLDAARRWADEILAEARERGAALTVATVLAHRALIDVRRGDLVSAEADTQAAIELASDLVGSEFVLVLAAPEAVLVGLDRDATTDSLRRVLDGTGARGNMEFLVQTRLSSSLGSSNSSLRVPLLLMSMAGNTRLSTSFRSRWISMLPVPLNSSKMTSSMRLPVSIRAVAMIVNEPPSSMLRAAPKNRFGRCNALESTPPESTLPEGGTMVL